MPRQQEESGRTSRHPASDSLQQNEALRDRAVANFTLLDLSAHVTVCKAAVQNRQSKSWHPVISSRFWRTRRINLPPQARDVPLKFSRFTKNFSRSKNTGFG